MKKITAFICLCVFALVFILSFFPLLRDKSYGQTVNLLSQGGMVVSIVLFFIFPARSKAPSANNSSPK